MMLAHALIRPAPSRPAQPDTKQASALFEAIVCDTHMAGLLTATLASAVNGFKNSNGSRLPADLEMYVPQTSNVTLGLPRWASEAALGQQLIDSVVTFYADLEPARRQLNRYFQDANSIGPERAVALHRFALAGAWRGACHSAIAAIRLISEEAEDLLPEFYVLNGGVLTRLLEAAARGETPCIDKTGQPFLPALPQRRHSSRRSVAQSALITAGGSTFRGFVRDVSNGGFGLEQMPIVAPGAQIHIELSTGRRFAGFVAWYSRGRAGIRFEKPLAPNDPMLWG